jgi:hypothetical protein
MSKKGKILLLASLVVVLMFTSRNAYSLLLQQGYSMPTTVARVFYINYGRFDNLQSKLATVPVTTTTNVTVIDATTLAAAATRTLTTSESGVLVIVSSTTGYTVTLPAPTTGMQFEIVSSATPTTGTAKIITDAATTFITGGVTVSSSSATAGTSTFACNGTSHIAISQNKTTSGGLIGTRWLFKALSTTVWYVTGTSIGVGGGGSTPFVTPCSTT